MANLAESLAVLAILAPTLMLDCIVFAHRRHTILARASTLHQVLHASFAGGFFLSGEAVLLTSALLLGHLLPVLLRSRPSIEDVHEEAGGECVGGGDTSGGPTGAELIVEAMRWGMVPSYSKADSASDALKLVCVCVHVWWG